MARGLHHMSNRPGNEDPCCSKTLGNWKRLPAQMFETLHATRRSITTSRFRKLEWLNGLMIVVVVALIITASLWTVSRARESLRSSVATKLTTVLQLETEAIRQWLKSEKQLAHVLASDSDLATLLENKDLSQRTRLANSELATISKRLRNKTCLLMTTDGRIVSRSGESWLVESVDDIGLQFCDALATGKSTISQLLRVRSASNEQKFVIVVAAPIKNENLETIGFLGIGHDLAVELTNLLLTSRSGISCETVAITPQGELISKSRFEGDSPMDFFSEVHDSAMSRRSASIATNLEGLPDHRGVKSSVASRWLPRFGVGLVTKMDHDEANAPVRQILAFIWTLFGLLILSALSALFYRWYLFQLRLQSKREELARKRLGVYELEEKIGEGGMGIVYRAKHALMRRATAVKILPPEKSSLGAIERFEREVKLTSQLKHPNTISIYDYGRTTNGLFYYAMELLEGYDLQQLVDREGAIADGRVINILVQICESLSEAHAAGLVHRDIKPSNIMLCNRGDAVDTVKVLDFGMVRELANPTSATSNDSLSGTPAYMAPECFTETNEVDTRVDLFAVGAVGFFLLTGKPFFDAKNLKELFGAHHSNLIQTATCRMIMKRGDRVSKRLVQLVAQCLARSKTDRPATVRELISALNRCSPVTEWSSVVASKWWQKIDSANSVDTETRLPKRSGENGLYLETTEEFDASNYLQSDSPETPYRNIECLKG